MKNKQDQCSECEVFKNYEYNEGSFAIGFFCPIKQSFTLRDSTACEWIVSDKLPF